MVLLIMGATIHMAMIHMAIKGVMEDIVHMVILVGSSSIMVASSNIMENSSMGSMESMECSAVASLRSGSEYSNIIYLKNLTFFSSCAL